MEGNISEVFAVYEKLEQDPHLLPLLTALRLWPAMRRAVMAALLYSFYCGKGGD